MSLRKSLPAGDSFTATKDLLTYNNARTFTLYHLCSLFFVDVPSVRIGRNFALLDPRKYRKNVMRCVSRGSRIKLCSLLRS